jgi:hypothetical protein
VTIAARHGQRHGLQANGSTPYPDPRPATVDAAASGDQPATTHPTTTTSTSAVSTSTSPSVPLPAMTRGRRKVDEGQSLGIADPAELANASPTCDPWRTTAP